MEPVFEKLDGVVSVTSGYTGGRKVDPSYEEVGSGRTGHTEAIKIVYDPRRVDYAKLLDVYWRNVDPTTAEGQFCDRGQQYRPAIYYADARQKRLAEASKRRIETTPQRFKSPLKVEIAPAGPFYTAENYHQDFYKKDPLQYNAYRQGCGRDRRLDELWGKDSR
jgi:peptide-methionine (S)-S-oxide reductase